MPLSSTIQTLEYAPEEIAKLISNELIASGQAKKEDTITVSYRIQEIGGDHMDRYRGTDTVTKIIVKIEKK